jgi:methylthioribose-1-phosphate isomerase
VIRVVDQRRLPDVLVDLELRTAGDSVRAINDGAVVGSPVQAQVAAVTLALAARRAAPSRAFARRATIRGAANALRLARPGSAAMAAVLDRMLALLEEAGPDVPGEEVARRLHDEAERIIGETVDDHGSLVGHLVAVVPETGDRVLRVLAAGSTGAMGGGQFGTALSAVQTLHHAGRRVHALLPEGRPGFEGARIAAWELRQAGVPHAVVPDAAAPGRIAAGEVDVVLVAADRVATNGDVVAPAGAYPLALAASAAGVPFLACATTRALDLAVPDASAARLEDGRPTPVLRAGGTRIPPDGTEVRNPLQEPVLAALVTGIVTEVGVLSAPWPETLEAAARAGDRRRAAAPGFAALQARRAGSAPSGPVAGPAGSPRPSVDVAALRNPQRGAEG